MGHGSNDGWFSRLRHGQFAKVWKCYLDLLYAGSLALLGNLFFYADSRQRPLAPLFGMLSAAVMGVVVTVLLLNQGPLLMEDNGSIRAQILYNVVHMFVSAGAILLALALSLGFTFSTITAQKPRRTVFEEE